MEHLVPARGLIGFRTEFLTETRGTGLLHHVFERYEPWHGELRTRPTGSLVADRRGSAPSFAVVNHQARGTRFFFDKDDKVAENRIALKVQIKGASRLDRYKQKTSKAYNM
jgi:predicted membrane GTPase involved in stress response